MEPARCNPQLGAEARRWWDGNVEAAEAVRRVFLASSAVVDWIAYTVPRLRHRRRALLDRARAELCAGVYRVTGVNTRTGKAETVAPAVCGVEALELLRCVDGIPI